MIDVYLSAVLDRGWDCHLGTGDDGSCTAYS